MHYAVIYAYSLLHSSCMFRHYYLAIFREPTPDFSKMYSSKIGHNKHTYVMLSVAQNFTGFG